MAPNSSSDKCGDDNVEEMYDVDAVLDYTSQLDLISWEQDEVFRIAHTFIGGMAWTTWLSMRYKGVIEEGTWAIWKAYCYQ